MNTELLADLLTIRGAPGRHGATGSEMNATGRTSADKKVAELDQILHINP